MLAERVDTLAGQEDGIGIVVGIIGPQGRRVISYGHPRQGNPRSLTGETVFEIGSVSKVFTALLLADMVGKGEVALSDPVANYLPADVKVPQRNGTSITLLDLVTHTSGLPFMTDEMPVYNDPTTTKYTAARLYQQHCHHTDAEAGGEACNRSQCGFAACAILLSVSIYEAMPAAGGLVSTVNDLLNFLSVAMGYKRSPLASSISATLSTDRPIDGSEQAWVGW